MIEALKTIQAKQNAYLARTGGVWALREADEVYNDYNRELIAAYKEAFNGAFLVKVNFYDDQRKRIVKGTESVYKEYTGQLVYNFGCDFVVPTKDEALESMIRSWNDDTACSMSNKTSLIERISARVEELGGLSFIWY